MVGAGLPPSSRRGEFTEQRRRQLAHAQRAEPPMSGGRRRQPGGRQGKQGPGRADKKKTAPPTRTRRVAPRDEPQPKTKVAPAATSSTSPAASPAAEAWWFPVVGIGASAGGFEALSQLLHALPVDSGLALVVVQHLAPQHDSALVSLLGGRTSIPVVQAAEGMRVERNRVHVVPPNVQMGITPDGLLHLAPRPSDRGQYNPIDFFFRFLGEAVQDQSIGVILSGTASDGAAGVRAIKAMGGITFAQKPDTARYDGMPRAAISSGFVDLVLAPEEIAAELVRIARQEFDPAAAAGSVPALEENVLERIFGLLRGATGVDFKKYKLPTIRRRIQRRMLLHRIPDLEHYVSRLEERPAEVQALYRDILIHVTHFFRAPDCFEALAGAVGPTILEGRGDEEPIRAWVAGCASGEEAYSLAIVLLEQLGERAGGVPIQIFATDLSEESIERAREGVYPETIAADVSPERLRRFFVRQDGGYRISKMVRDLCVFARQDLTRDPPFSRLDLILCRNVLIYMGTELQRKVLAVLHYALKPKGVLVVGRAEAIGPRADLFSLVDKKNRIYEKKAQSAVALVPVDYPVTVAAGEHKAEAPAVVNDRLVQNEANRLIQDRYAPPGVIVDDRLQIVQFRGHTGHFLEPAPGDPSLNLLKMVRQGLLHGLRSALQQARKTRTAVLKERLTVKYDDSWRNVGVEVLPLTAAAEMHFLVLFHDETPAAPPSKRAGPRRRAAQQPHAPAGKGGDDRVQQLQQELASTR